MSATYRSAQVNEPGGTLHLVEKEIPEPAPGRVPGECRGGRDLPLRRRVHQRAAAWREVPAGPRPRDRRPRRRHRRSCRGLPSRRPRRGRLVRRELRALRGLPRGRFHQLRLPADPRTVLPGGYADTVIVPASALARILEGFTAAEAAPMGCAGVTVFNALRRSAARPGGPGCRPRHRRARAPWGAVRLQALLRDRRYFPRRRQGAPGQAAGRPSLHRQPDAGHRRGAASARRGEKSCWVP